MIECSNEEYYAAKWKQNCSCFLAQLKFVNFLYSSKKCHNQSCLNPVFNEDSKMGSASYVAFVSFKLLLKNRKYNFCEVLQLLFKHSPVGQKFLNSLY